MRILSGSTKIAFGFGLGVMAVEVAKEVAPAFHGLGGPLLKAAVKSGMILARAGRVKLDEFRETLADVSAEAAAELPSAPQSPAGEPTAAEIQKQNVAIM